MKGLLKKGKMFFHVTMSRHVSLHPAFFGDKFQATLEKKLKAEVEGQWTETYGYIILVTGTSRGRTGEEEERERIFSFFLLSSR